jgi:hypothetical protein
MSFHSLLFLVVYAIEFYVTPVYLLGTYFKSQSLLAAPHPQIVGYPPDPKHSDTE